MFYKFAVTCGLLFSASSLHAADEAKLLANINVPMSYHGLSWQNSKTKILVKNLAYEKNVQVVYEGVSKTERVSASYVGPANDGYEVWEANINLDLGAYHFFVEYKVSGETFILDNQGQKFDLQVGPVLYNGQAIQQLNTSNEFSSNNATITAAVRSDLSPVKKVHLHYSFDGFKSEQELNLSFVPEYRYGYGVIQWSNDQEAEFWSGSILNIPKDVQAVTYYLSYEANGDIYVDNNFGKNYQMVRRQD